MSYGEYEKKIVFGDTDKRHADLRRRLHVDELKQGEFFRAIVTGYIEQDEDLLKFLDKYKSQAKVRKKILNKGYKKAKELKNNFRLSEDEIENIFDLIAKENEDL